MTTPIRRIVTGHNPAGKSTVVHDGLLPDGPAAHDRYVWQTAHTPANNFGTDDASLAALRLEPPKNGSVFRIVEFPPMSVMAGMSAEQKDEFFAGLFAGMDAAHCRVDTSRSPGMHKTSTVDYVVVLRGEITLLLEEAEVTLKTGDLVVQRGTNHDWLVRGDEPALLGVVMLSAQPV